MNNLIEVANGSIDILRKNAPKVLLITGIASGVGAVCTSGLVSYKANDIIKDIKSDPKCDNKKTAFKAYATKVVPLYIPVAILEAGSVICLVKSYDINAKRLAAATALAQVSIESLKLYKDKARKILGDKKAEELEKEVKEEKEKQQEIGRLAGDPYSVVQWFRDELTGQEFLSTKENISEAQLQLNLRLHAEMTISINEWIDILNDYSFNSDKGSGIRQLTHVLNGDEIGWEEGAPVYIRLKDGHKTDETAPCWLLSYNLPPRAGYRHRYY